MQCGRFQLEFSRPLVMGIVNLTPDSFTGDGAGSDIRKAIGRAEEQLSAGADILDLGAESSRPGALPVPEVEELARLLPVLKALKGCGVPLSVDTYKPGVMAAALDAGADMINDINGFRASEARKAVRNFDCGLCLMHMQGQPKTMQQQPIYANVEQDVFGFLKFQAEQCEKEGIVRDRLLLDPGFGFGKTLENNVTMFRALGNLCALGLPVLVGVSRKSMLGELIGRPVEQRLHASVAAALMAVLHGASVVRVHDVAATVDALKIGLALK